MNIPKIERSYDYDALVMVWMASVKATHNFLCEEDIGFYYDKVLRNYMPHLELYAIKNEDGNLCAFIGLSAKMIEMLFVRPDAIGKGYGSALLRFAIEKKGMRKVDVNEQNHRALQFYQKHGFFITGRNNTDEEGKPYPILHLEWQTSSD